MGAAPAASLNMDRELGNLSLGARWRGLTGAIMKSRILRNSLQRMAGIQPKIYPVGDGRCSVHSVSSNKEVAEMMGRIRFMGFGITLVGCLSVAPVFAGDKPAKAPIEDGSKVMIMSPKNGDKVSDSFDIKYELTKGSQATHVHAYVDDEYQKGFAGSLKGLSKGTHKVTVTGATKDHDPVTATHSITVDVQ
jgi:hypothetical protein